MTEKMPDECKELFEKFLAEKAMSNETEDDAWGIPAYKHSHINAMYYAWQYLWNQRPADAYEALKRFADIKADDGDNYESYPDEVIIKCEITAGDLKAARVALAKRETRGE